MKIGETAPLKRSEHVSHERHAAREATSRASAGAVPSDTAAVMGIPEAELTGRVQKAIMALMSEVDHLRKEVADLRLRLRDAEALGDQDPLLPVFNRRAFVRELSRTLSYVERYGGDASLVYIDLDNFKQVNDRLGHSAGDAALAHAASIIKKSVRETDVVARVGGDEFGIILAQAGEETARAKAESLTEAIAAAPLQWEGTAVALSLSYGVTAFRSGESADEALARADKAMYARKAGGARP